MLLPAPDYLEFQLPHLGACLVTDDGSPLTAQVIQRLGDQGWPVVVLTLPEDLVKRNTSLDTKTVRSVALDIADETRTRQQLLAIEQAYGTIHTFIHLHPQEPVSNKGLVKAVFFLAKQLQPFLTRSEHQERRSFITLTRLDGELGLGRLPYRVVGGGLFGLTKTLRLEWPTVFCRAIDVSPELSSIEAANALIAEIHDPNVFIREVGYGQLGRVTLTCLATTA